jgi:polar amino acid transport system permease protein
MEFRFYEIWRETEYVERLITGIGWSLFLTVCAAVIGFSFALVLAVGRRSANRWYSTLSACYVELIRNTPLIVQLFFVVFGLPMLLGYRWPFPASALLALTLNFSAYYSEIIRAGLDSVDKGQLEAAQVLNLSVKDRFFRIVLPQALAKVYPSLVSQFVFLFLTTGIISEVGIEELTWSGRFIADRTFRDFEVYLLLTALYVLLAVGFRGVFYLIGQQAFPWQKAR